MRLKRSLIWSAFSAKTPTKLDKLMLVMSELRPITIENFTGRSIARHSAPGSPSAACMIVETVVYLRYKLDGKHHELWVKTEDAKHVRKHLEAQGAVIYWTERK